MKPSYLILSLLFLSIFSPSGFAQSQFGNAVNIPAAEGYRITPLVGDYDGDGDMDILGTGWYVQNSTARDATVLFRNDAGNFVVVDTNFPWFYHGGMYQWADLDNDNDLDIIAGGCPSYCYNSKLFSIYRNDGADQFTLITAPTNIVAGKAFTLVDYNNDGLIDIEIATQSDHHDSVIDHTFYKNMGNFVFEKTFELPVPYGELTWGDLNNDGWNDFVLFDHAYENMRDGTFEAFTSPDGMQQHARHFIFDADNDGDQDVITSNSIVMLNDGLGHLSFGSILIPYENINSLLIADMDGDGNKDMVVSGGSGNEGKTQLFRSNGDMSFTPEDLNEQYANSAYDLTLTDIDNDNDPDILLSGAFSFDLIILENGLTTELSKPVAPDNLQASPDVQNVVFSWDAGTDLEQSSLEYNFYLTYGDTFIVTPNADTTTGSSFLPGVANASAIEKRLATALLPEGYFRWSVQSVDAELNASSFATPQEFTLYKNNPSNAPTNLMRTALSDESVSLAWTDNSVDETGFTIERSALDGNSGFEPLHQATANTVTYIDNTVSPRRVYYYRVRLDGSSAVAYSNVIRIETPSVLGSGPVITDAMALNSASAKIDWNYAGIGITGFTIERSRDDKNHFTPVGFANAADHSYIDQQLESGMTYYYRIFAVDGEDFSNYSNIAKVSLPLKALDKIALPSLNYESKYVMGGIAWADYDNDGYDDLFLSYKAQLFHNDGNGTFSTVTQTGIVTSESANTFTAVWGDYDNDGFLDLFYYTNQNRSWIYRGHGDGTFTAVPTLINGDLSEITNATWIDVDQDSDLDLSIAGGRYYYRYDGNDTFVRVNLPGGLPSGYYNSSVISWGDYDDDGDPDAFLGNYGKDEFFQNNADGSFTAITNERITSDYNYDCCPIATQTALWTDFNNDRKLDLTVFHSGGPIYAYTNRDNHFDSAFYSFAYEREPWKNIFWTDYDNDADLDLFVMGQYNNKTEIWENKEGQPMRLLKGGPLYDYVSSDANFSWNDYDNDGYSDLFQFDSGHEIYKNISNGNSWIKVRLKGRISNSTGLGAKVFVKANSSWQRSDVTTHHSYRVQQGFMSLFGLGNATQVDSIKIIWPSGNRQYLKNINVNQVILIDENDAQEKVIQAPSNLVAEVQFPSTVILRWTDRSDAETGFIIEMMADEQPFTEVGTVAANVNSFEVSGLTTGVKYKFRVRASPSSNVKWTNVAEVQIRLFTEEFAGDLTAYQSRPEGMAWGDPDGDGDPDLFVGSQSFEPDAIYYNNNGIFTRNPLRNTSNYSRQAQWIDYNNDGHLDLHVSVGGGILASAEALNDVLYKNNGTGQLIEEAGHLLAKDGSSDFTAAWGDLNNDGYPDMVAPRSSGTSEIYINLGGNLTLVPADVDFGGGTILLGDFDNDRDLDLLSGSYYSSRLFENVNGQFTPRENSGLPYDFGAFVLEDFDNDGVQELLAIADQTLKLYLMDPFSMKFKQKENIFSSIGPVSNLSVGDLDNNGFLDVFVTGPGSFGAKPNRIFLNNGNLQFESLSDPILDRELNGTAVADVNKDGRLDVITLARADFDTKRVLLQGTKNENHWLRVKLKGVGTNMFGLGARIRLFTGNNSQVRDMRSGSGGVFTNEQIAHFGLGSTTTIDYLKVEWPSGEDQWIANPAIDVEVVVVQENTPGPPAPADPSDLSATLREPGYIDLQWSDNSDNEKHFRIERAVAGKAFEFWREVTENTTTFTDSAFVSYSGNRVEIRYRVVAVSKYMVESEPSNEASIPVFTGIGDETNGLAIFPQPANAMVFVRSERTIQEVSIIGARGEVITALSFRGSHEVDIPLKGIAPGMYFIRVTDESGTVVKKLLVTSDN